MNDPLSKCFRQVLFAQLLLSAFAVILAVLLFDVDHAKAVLLGAVVALVNTVLSRRSIASASTQAYKNPGLGMVPIFSGLVQRFAVFIGSFIFGVLVLGLLPLPLLAGFLFAQLGYVACRDN